MTPCCQIWTSTGTASNDTGNFVPANISDNTQQVGADHVKDK